MSRDLEITIAGSQGAGKTRLLRQMVPFLIGQGFNVRVIDDSDMQSDPLLDMDGLPAVVVRTQQTHAPLHSDR